MAMRYMWSAMLSGPDTSRRTQPVRFVSCEQAGLLVEALNAEGMRNTDRAPEPLP